MTSKLEDLRDFQRIIQKYSYCPPIPRRNFSLIENPHSNQISTLFPHKIQNLQVHNKLKQSSSDLPIKDFYHLNTIKYQNYKYIKYDSNITFLKKDLSSKNLKQHSLISKGKKLEMIYDQRKNEIPSDKRYRLDKTTRILNSRYQEFRNIKTNSKQTVYLLEELKENLKRLNETQNHKANIWVSPYMARMEVKEKLRGSNKITNSENGLEICVKLFQELIKMDVEKNVRLNITSSSSHRKKMPNTEINKKFVNSNGFSMKEEWINQKGIEEENVSIQSFQEYFYEGFNKKQWNRLLFALSLGNENSKISFEKFLLFFQVFLNKTANLEQKHGILKRSMAFPNEEIKDWNQEIIEISLKNCLLYRKEEFIHKKGFIETLSRQIFEMILNKNRHRERIYEIIELIYLRKNCN